jgi:hypothetical protein
VTAAGNQITHRVTWHRVPGVGNVVAIDGRPLIAFGGGHSRRVIFRHGRYPGDRAAFEFVATSDPLGPTPADIKFTLDAGAAGRAAVTDAARLLAHWTPFWESLRHPPDLEVRVKFARYIPCFGQAHQPGVDQDHCMCCLPEWGQIMVCPTCEMSVKRTRKTRSCRNPACAEFKKRLARPVHDLVDLSKLV